MMRSDLNSIESLLYRLITAPSGVVQGLAHETSLGANGLSEIIAGDERLSPAQRVDIYANMYFYRLLDALKEDFPATLRVLGADGFHNLVTGYLIEYPPTHFSLLYAGSRLADFLGGHPLRSEVPFIADLARLERALIDVFHANDAPPLSLDDMRAIAPANWPAVRMRLHPAVELLKVEWKVAEVVRQVEAGGQPNHPAKEDGCLLVWRSRNRVHFREIDSVERAALALVSQGAGFAEICEAIAGAIPLQGAAAEINRRFEGWLRDAILIGA